MFIMGFFQLRSVTKFKSELRFSCPVLVDMKKIKTSSGFIKGTLVKDKTNSVGERVLPWRRLTSNMISSLPDYPSSVYHTSLLNIHTAWVHVTDDGSRAVDHDKPYPRHQLRDVCRALMKDPKIYKDKMFCAPRKRPRGVSPLDLYQSTIILDSLKMFEEKPAMFLTVFDHDIGKSLLEDTHLSTMDLMRDFGDVHNPQELNETLLEGYDMLKSILKLNSHRIQQDSDSCPWKMKSFLRMRYPFKISMAFQLETKCMTRFTEGGRWKSPSAHLEYMQMVLEMCEQPLQRADILESAEASAEFFKPVCDSCGRMTDCKKCAACNNVYYCSRSCQRRAWPQHKVHCSE